MERKEKKKIPVFMLNNVNGSFSLSFNNELRVLLADATKAYLAMEQSDVVLAFSDAMKKVKGCEIGVDHVKYVEVRGEGQQWQPSIFVLVSINGSLFLSCNGSFGRVLLDVVDASADEGGMLPLSMYALAKTLDSQINWQETGTDG